MSYLQSFLNYLRNAKDKVVSWLNKSELTVCHELERQTHITAEELKLDLEYCAQYVSDRATLTYKALIIPVVWLMRKSKLVSLLTLRIAKQVWLNKVWAHMRGKSNE